MSTYMSNLFKEIGEIIQGVNLVANGTNDWLDDLETTYTDISDMYTSNNREDLLVNVYTTLEGMKKSVVGYANQLAHLATIRLQHKSIRDTITDMGDDAGLLKTLGLLSRQMLDDSQEIEDTIVAIGAVSESKENTDAGSVVALAELDGFVSPGVGFPANRYYNNATKYANSQLAEPETVTVECVTESTSDLAGVGSEVFQIIGEKGVLRPYDREWGGSGTGPSLTPIQGSGLISNNSFETYIEDAPTGWLMAEGSSGINYFEANESNLRHGKRSLKMVGSANLPFVKLSQRLSLATMNANRRYAIAIHYKPNTLMSDDVNLDVRIEDQDGIGLYPTGAGEGTWGGWGSLGNIISTSLEGSSALSLSNFATADATTHTLTTASGGFTTAMIGDTFVLASGTNAVAGKYTIVDRTDTNTVTLDGSPATGGALASGVGVVRDNGWQIATGTFILPRVLPESLHIVIRLFPDPTELLSTITNWATAPIYIDWMGLAPLTYHNGLGFFVYSGADRFVVGDKFTFAITQSTTGAFQDFFRRNYKFQLPSDTSATIADSLITD